MTQQPWKVRLTADSTGTLDAVHATVELVDRAALALGEPWAHYEPASLSGYNNGDPITLWADTTSNGRDLTNTDGTDEPTLFANALNGLPGAYLGGDSLLDVRYMTANVAQENVDRVTFLAVVAQIAQQDSNEATLAIMRGATDVGLYVWRESGSYDLYVDAAEESSWFQGVSTTDPLNVAGGLLLEAERVSTGVTLEADGTLVASDSGTAAAPSTIDRLGIGDTGPTRLVLCELVVFVTPDEHTLVDQYRSLLQGRWGL